MDAKCRYMDFSNEFCSQACQQVGVGVGGSALNPGKNFQGYILLEHDGNWESKLRNSQII